MDGNCHVSWSKGQLVKEIARIFKLVLGSQWLGSDCHESSLFRKLVPPWILPALYFLGGVYYPLWDPEFFLNNTFFSIIRNNKMWWLCQFWIRLGHWTQRLCLGTVCDIRYPTTLWIVIMDLLTCFTPALKVFSTFWHKIIFGLHLAVWSIRYWLQIRFGSITFSFWCNASYLSVLEALLV